MNKYVLSARAKLDLQQIWDHIAEDNIDATDKVRNRLRDAIRDLARMPGIGHPRQDVRNPRYRFPTVFSYVIVYLPDAKPLQVVRIVHGRRDLMTLLD